jgi:hypothetical protein
MTPKEKAKELFGKYAMYLRQAMKMLKYVLAVDEILNVINDMNYQNVYEEVKQEIVNFKHTYIHYERRSI